MTRARAACRFYRDRIAPITVAVLGVAWWITSRIA
jgi:hypothetical protein